MPGKVVEDVCVDCRKADATLDIRKRRLCRDCFMRYVNSKVLKRMESYRFKNSREGDTRRRLLLPVSGGISSLVLLQTLDWQLQRQHSNRNRTAYDLSVLLVEDVQSDETRRLQNASWYDLLQKQFSLHNFEPAMCMSNVFTLDAELERDLAEFGLHRAEAEANQEFTARILASASSVTAGTDIQNILLTRLIWAYSKQQNCESILWGHSDSRLASKALAGVAKGRGGSLPFEICDGPSPAGINFNYPLRDLFKTELSLYASLLPDVFKGLILEDDATAPEKVLIRNTSIDDLLTNYINSQGEKYPSIMANVVRTVNKLQAPNISSASANCRICLMPVQVEVQNEISVRRLCYGCSRTRQDLRKGSLK